jgi:segregation and condensation protein A
VRPVLAHQLELDLEAFEGPFDLLLTLVLKEEIALADVDVAGVVLAFVEELAGREPSRSWGVAGKGGKRAARSTVLSTGKRRERGLLPPAAPGSDTAGLCPAEVDAGQGREELDLDACGEFLVLVSSLLELKARALVAGEDVELDELEPEEAAEELARRLAEYRRFKEASRWLAERLGQERDRHFRLGPAPLAPLPERRLAPQDPGRLADALRALAAEPPPVSVEHMSLRFPPVSVFLDRFRSLVGRGRAFDFDHEVEGLTVAEQAVAFLALLELRKTNEIALSQAAPFAPIRVTRAAQETISAPERRTASRLRSA